MHQREHLDSMCSRITQIFPFTGNTSTADAGAAKMHFTELLLSFDYFLFKVVKLRMQQLQFVETLVLFEVSTLRKAFIHTHSGSYTELCHYCN